MRRNRTLGLVAAIVLTSAGCSGESLDPGNYSPSSLPNRPDGTIAVYTASELGSNESMAELKDVKEAGFDEVIAYGSMNGQTIEGIRRYLDAAQKMDIGVVFSVKDVLGDIDTDEDNAAHHRALFGETTDAQVATVLKAFIGHPAVTRVLISDERPGGPEDLQEWLPQLKKRRDQLSKVKPTSVVLYWNQDSPAFYQAVKQYADDLQIDYYPLPENKLYGPLSTISDIGRTLWQTAGRHGYFVLQAFGWDPKNHPEGVELGFTTLSPPPTTEQMVDMAKRAVEGHGDGGATNLAFYAFGEPNAASLNSVKEAVRQIRAAAWWQSRGN